MAVGKRLPVSGGLLVHAVSVRAECGDCDSLSVPVEQSQAVVLLSEQGWSFNAGVTRCRACTAFEQSKASERAKGLAA